MQFPNVTKLACDLDDFLRKRDFASGRTAGGFLHRHFGIDRHTVWAILLPTAACFFAVMATPGWVRFAWAAIAAIVVGFAITLPMAVFARKKSPLWLDLLVQIVVVSAVMAAMFRAPIQYSDSSPYQNLLVLLTLAVAICLLAAMLLTPSVFSGLPARTNYRRSLCRTELFASRGDVPPVTGTGLLWAVLLAPIRSPLELLFPPSVAALLARPNWLTSTVLITFAICFAALVISGLNERFGMMWKLLSQAFFEGAALPVSLIVIALAVARFFGVTYVTTVFDTAEGVKISIFLLSIYVLSWWFGYWTNRLVTDRLIHMIEPQCPSGTPRIDYRICRRSVATHVPFDNRVIQIHGSSRFVVLRENVTITRKNGNTDTFDAFQTYPALDLLNEVGFAGAPGGRAKPTFLQIKGRAFAVQGLASAFMVLVLYFGVVHFQDGVQDAEIVTAIDTGGGILPEDLLSRPKVIVVAASGGGTRAALFTAAILEGIATRGKAGDVVLGSGVSGGGAALAYFAAFRSSLTAPYKPEPWAKFYKAMEASYIRDVLDRASEMRMVSTGRLGMLLRESFHDHWGDGEPGSAMDTCKSPPSGPGCDFGLILNSTLAGRLALSKETLGGKSIQDVEPAHRRETTSSLAGGRIIFTNLKLPIDFTPPGVEPDAASVPVIIRGPGVTLEHGAAVNANFPPVFPNAAVDITLPTQEQDRYWATDGGAADNRGLEMLLYSILTALQKKPPKSTLPDLQIIVVDAGAYSDSFVQDRGVSSSLGAGAHFASSLDADLRSAILKLYQQRGGQLSIEYVYMPRQLRASGSFGTHWMLQKSITVHQKDEQSTFLESIEALAGRGDNPQVTISGDQMVDVLRSLYNRTPVSFDPKDSSKPLTLKSDACQVLVWARTDITGEKSREEWENVMKALGDNAPDQQPPCK